MQPMTPDQAIELLEDATGKLSADRRSHQVILEALDVLRKATASAELPKPKTKGDK